MDNTDILIYNELVALRDSFQKYAEAMEGRVSALEQFKNYTLGIVFMIGVGLRCTWDYIKERFI